jgi:hypothetical protein
MENMKKNNNKKKRKNDIVREWEQKQKKRVRIKLEIASHKMSGRNCKNMSVVIAARKICITLNVNFMMCYVHIETFTNVIEILIKKTLFLLFWISSLILMALILLIFSSCSFWLYLVYNLYKMLNSSWNLVF